MVCFSILFCLCLNLFFFTEYRIIFDYQYVGWGAKVALFSLFKVCVNQKKKRSARVLTFFYIWIVFHISVLAVMFNINNVLSFVIFQTLCSRKIVLLFCYFGSFCVCFLFRLKLVCNTFLSTSYAWGFTGFAKHFCFYLGDFWVVFET